MLRLLLVLGLLAFAAGETKAQTCSSFRTCGEAMRSLQSGNRSLDRNGDGVPCEALCKGSGGSTAPRQQSAPSSGGRAPASSAPKRSSPSPQRAAKPAAGPVALISVGDGDTIRVRGSNGPPITIRMACIDAPETAQGQAGADATAALSQFLAAGRLEIRPQTVDRYGRTVAEVYAGGRNVNLEMARTGAAFVYRQYLSGCDQNAYLEAEAYAQRFRQGVWRWGNVQPPWEFRQQRKK